LEVQVVKSANKKYAKEGQIFDLPDHIAKAGIEKGLFKAVTVPAKKATKKKVSKAKK
jgi:hypothetical protein